MTSAAFQYMLHLRIRCRNQLFQGQDEQTLRSLWDGRLTPERKSNAGSEAGNVKQCL